MNIYHVGQKVVCIDQGDVMIDLVEMPNPDSEEFYRGYYADKFRPVVERKTSIAIFHEILNKHRTGVPA